MGKFNSWKIDLSGACLCNKDKTHDGKTILLLTGEELEKLQREEPNKVVISIFGEETLAKDCDLDTRFGYSAYGFFELWNEK